MKKIMAVALAAASLFALLSSLCLADRVIGGENPDRPDGAADIPQGAGSSADIQVSVTEVASRYAVDVTFPDLSLSFGDIVWNADALSYEAERLPEEDFEIIVTNHSDKTILMWGRVQKADPHDGISVLCDITQDGKRVIPQVRPQAQGPQQESLQVTIRPASDWDSVLSYLIGNGTVSAGLAYRIGTVSVFVSKTNEE